MTPQLNRNKTIDVAKGIGIFLLFLITHNFWMPSPILRIDGYVLMPFFFILCGMVFKKDSLKHTAKRKALSLLVPYFFFCFVGVGVSIFLYSIGMYEGRLFDDYKRIISLVYWIIAGTPSELKNIYMNPMWFVSCLFFSSLLLQIILKFNNLIVRIISVLSCLLLSYVLSQFKKEGSYPFNIDVALLAVFFLYVGYSSKKYSAFLELKPKTNMIIALPIMLLFVYSLYLVDQDIPVLAYYHIPNYILFIVISLSGSYLLYYTSSILSLKNERNILQSIGRNSIVYMAFHWCILHGFLYNILSIIGVNESYMGSLWYVFSILLCIAQFAIIQILEKPTKKVLGNIKNRLEKQDVLL